MQTGRVFALVTALLLTTVVPASAQTDPSAISGNEMADGPWTGSFTASGVDERSESGVGLTVTIDDAGTFSFTISGGSASGMWSSEGTSNWETTSGQDASITGTSTLESSGSLAGSRTNLAGTGSTSQSGTLKIESGGQSITRPISENTPLAFSMTVTSASCEAAHGTLSGSFINGTFTAINGASFERIPSGTSAHQLVDGLVEYTERFNSFTRRLGWRDGSPEGTEPPERFPTNEFLDLLAEGEAVLNELRNASACLTLQVGEHRLETWDNLITRHMAQTILAAAVEFKLASSTVRSLVSAGLRVGAIGPGATDQAAAAAAELALHDEMEAYVRENVGSPDECSSGRSCVFATPDVVNAFVVGTQMGWVYEVVNPSTGQTRSIPASDMATVLERVADAESSS